ncbi:hypothetical protein [Halovenus sp. HT40]|uniref:hypothetical protein n=1 Tax=Halovenus sp. HT40 TaxID=3126691 RepID=UPI00300E8671
MSTRESELAGQSANQATLSQWNDSRGPLQSRVTAHDVTEQDPPDEAIRITVDDELSTEDLPRNAEVSNALFKGEFVAGAGCLDLAVCAAESEYISAPTDTRRSNLTVPVSTRKDPISGKLWGGGTFTFEGAVTQADVVEATWRLATDLKSHNVPILDDITIGLRNVVVTFDAAGHHVQLGDAAVFLGESFETQYDPEQHNALFIQSRCESERNPEDDDCATDACQSATNVHGHNASAGQQWPASASRRETEAGNHVDGAVDADDSSQSDSADDRSASTIHCSLYSTGSAYVTGAATVSEATVYYEAIVDELRDAGLLRPEATFS